MAGNRLLQRYLDEIVSRCSLILALYGRPHSSECAVNEHSEIIAALRRGDVEAAIARMNDHIGSVEARALLAGAGDSESNVGAVLSRYAEAIESRQAAPTLSAGKKRSAR
jgi:DNA-binding GntR family transcriptional regulator